MPKILVIRVGRIGDMVMITPALRAILDKHPEAEVHLLTSPDGRHVLRGFDPRLVRVLVYERRGWDQALRHRRLQRELADGGYGCVYCFETNPSYRALLEGVSVEKYFLGSSDEIVPFPARCLRLVEAPPRAPMWVLLPLTGAGRTAARAMYAAAGIDETDFVVGLHPSFSALRRLGLSAREARRRKTWPRAAFARLAGLLADYARRRGIEIRIVCDLLPEDRPLGEALRAESGGRVTLFSEPPDFERYKATLARMNLLVTPDTGPMHMAAALGTPLVALFAGRDPRDCGPYTDPGRYAVLRAEDMPLPERGLAAIPPETVFEACRRFFPA